MYIAVADKIWNNKYVKEFVLLVVSVFAIQLALGLGDFLNLINTAKDWGDLATSFKAWIGTFTFALVVTIIRQSAAWAIAQLAGSSL